MRAETESEIVDSRRMALALGLAENGLYSAAPNPRVGCVVFRNDRLVGRGWHRAAGEPHAEIAALNQAGDQAQDSEIYVSLEPCAHSGKTPPCADALIRAKPKRVVAAMPDPDPRVAGKGFAKLRQAGIQVSIGTLRRQALELNLGFVSRQVRGRPWVRIKIAATMDGRTALASGLSQWITGENARADAHHFRARSCAVLTGIGTAETDNPQLTARQVAAVRQPLRVLLDSRLRASPNLHLLSDGNPTLVFCAQPRPDQSSSGFSKFSKFSKISGDGVEVVSMPDPENPRGVDLRKMLAALAAREINEVTVEAGRKLCGALLAAGLADEVAVYFAPAVFGEGARAMFAVAPPDSPGAATRMTLQNLHAFGDGDFRAVYRRAGAVREMDSRIS